MKVLLTGADGQLGRCLRDRRPAHWRLCALNHAELDIADARAVSRRVAGERPDWIINAAAYTAVDRAESEAARARAVNEQGAANLALAAREAGARLLQVSTDYVFDGELDRPYTEEDAAGPLNEYGRGKLLGEHAVLRSAPRALVVRTSGVYSEYGHNFVKTMLRLAAGGAAAPTRLAAGAPRGGAAEQAWPAEGRVLRIVADQYTCPTYAGDLAQALIGLMGRGQTPPGIYHYCGATAVSWHEFAQRIFQCARQLDADFPAPSLEAIPASDYAGPARRPRYSVLSCEKIRALGMAGRPLDEVLPGVVRALMN